MSRKQCDNVIFLLMWKTILLLLYCATASSYPKTAFCVAVSMIFWLCQGKYREGQCTMKLRVKWRHKVTVQLENQELWLEQHGHCMKPALREPLFIYPLPARRHNVNTKHAKHHQTLSLKQASSSMCHHHTVFTETEPVFLVIINNSSIHLGISG